MFMESPLKHAPSHGAEMQAAAPLSPRSRLRAKAWADAIRAARRLAVEAAVAVGGAFAGLTVELAAEAERHAARKRERDALGRLAGNRHLMRDVGLDAMEVRRLLDAPDWRR